MNHPERLEELLLASVGSAFAAEDRAELNEILRHSSEAREFAAEFLQDDAALIEALSTRKAASGFRPVRKSASAWMRMAAAVAILIVPLGIMLWPDAPAAAWVQGSSRGSGIESGTTYRPGDRIELQKGRVVLRFATGAKFAAQSPCSFQITSDNGVELFEGRATTRVPGPIKGFVVQTPTERILDLGTSFGVDVAPTSGETSVAVFEGEVVVGEGRHLYAGESVRAAEPIEFSVEPFLGTWQTSFGIESIGSHVRVARPDERTRPGEIMASEHLLLFPEEESVQLSADLEVSTTQPGEFHRKTRHQTASVAEGEVVDSYLLQFNPGSDPVAREFTTELRFDRPIVGLILSTDLLDASDEILALPLTNLTGIFRRGLNVDDQVDLSEDRRTLRIHLHVQNGVDQMRVLVSSDPMPDQSS